MAKKRIVEEPRQWDFFCIALVGAVFLMLFGWHYSQGALEKAENMFPRIEKTQIQTAIELADEIDDYRTDNKLEAELYPQFKIRFHRRDIDKGSVEYWISRINEVLSSEDYKDLKVVDLETVTFEQKSETTLNAHVTFIVTSAEPEKPLQDPIKRRVVTFPILLDDSVESFAASKLVPVLETLLRAEEAGKNNMRPIPQAPAGGEKASHEELL